MVWSLETREHVSNVRSKGVTNAGGRRRLRRYVLSAILYIKSWFRRVMGIDVSICLTMSVRRLMRQSMYVRHVLMGGIGTVVLECVRNVRLIIVRSVVYS